MTWGEFKDWIEKQGVKDDDQIDYMDFDIDAEMVRRSGQDGTFFVCVE